MALLTELKQLADSVAAKDAVESDARIVMQAIGSFYTLIGQASETISAKCAKHGLPAMLAVMPSITGDPDAATKVGSALALLQQLWTNYSDAAMPEFYAEQYTPPVVETPVEE